MMNPSRFSGRMFQFTLPAGQELTEKEVSRLRSRANDRSYAQFFQDTSTPQPTYNLVTNYEDHEIGLDIRVARIVLEKLPKPWNTKGPQKLSEAVSQRFLELKENIKPFVFHIQ